MREEIEQFKEIIVLGQVQANRFPEKALVLQAISTWKERRKKLPTDLPQYLYY